MITQGGEKDDLQNIGQNIDCLKETFPTSVDTHQMSLVNDMMPTFLLYS